MKLKNTDRLSTKLVFLLLLSAIMIQIPSNGNASGYPADMPRWHDFKGDVAMLIRRDLQPSGAVAINVSYGRSLANSQSLSMVIRIKYSDGIREMTVPMEKRDGQIWWARVTNGCLKGMIGGCEQYGTEAMNSLLYWASWNDRGTNVLNALNIELAFVNEKGEWDSRDGQNYRFQFPEHRHN